MAGLRDITIIADNGGGVTLQAADTDAPYMHSYLQPQQVVEDIQDLVNGGDVADWDGNEYDGDDNLMDVDYDDARNGGYRVYRLDNLMAIVDNPDDDEWRDDYGLPGDSWGNVRDIVTGLRAAC